MTTYAVLQSDLRSWINRPSLSLGALQTAIRMAEAELARRARTRDQITKTTLTLNDRIVDLPADFVAPVAITLDQTDSELELVTPEVLRENSQSRCTGTPRLFAYEGNKLVLAPYPTATATVTADISYYKRYTAFSADNDTNWILRNHYDVFFACAMKFVSRYDQDPEQEQRWTQAFEEGLEQLHLSETMGKLGGSALSSFLQSVI